MYERHRFDLGSNTISYMVNGVANQYSTREMLDEVRFQNKSLQLQTSLHLFSNRSSTLLAFSMIQHICTAVVSHRHIFC